jgi:hypothetical protein
MKFPEEWRRVAPARLAQCLRELAAAVRRGEVTLTVAEFGAIVEIVEYCNDEMARRGLALLRTAIVDNER